MSPNPHTRAHFAARFFMFWLRNEHSISLTGGMHHYRAKFFTLALLNYGGDPDGPGSYPVDGKLLRRISLLTLANWNSSRLLHFSPHSVNCHLEILMPYEQKLTAELIVQSFQGDLL
jgi:hypothetical protein